MSETPVPEQDLSWLLGILGGVRASEAENRVRVHQALERLGGQLRSAQGSVLRGPRAGAGTDDAAR